MESALKGLGQPNQIISLQYSLAMNIGSHLELFPMLRIFSRKLLCLLDSVGVYVWIRDSHENPYQRFIFPESQSAAASSGASAFVPYIEKEVINTQRNSWCGIRSGYKLSIQKQNFHVFRLGGIGLIAIGREQPLSDGQIACLLPVFDKLAQACANCLHYEERVLAQQSAAEALNYSQQVNDFKDLVIAKLSRKISQSLVEIEQAKGGESYAGERSSALLAFLTGGMALMSKELDCYLDLSKQTFELNEVSFDIRNMAKSLQAEFACQASLKQLAFSVTVDEVIPQLVTGDQKHIRLMLSQLVDSAIRNTDDGEVVVTIAPTHIADNQMRIAFTVSDTGTGILKDKLRNLMALDLKDVGQCAVLEDITGLRFAIVNQLVRRQCGHISASSVLGQGTCFTVELDLTEAESLHYVDSEPKPASLPVALLAEGPSVNRMVAVRLLEKMGYRVEIANNSVETLRLWLAIKPDITFIDVDMPEVDGYTTTQTIRERERCSDSVLPMVALGARLDKRTQDKCSAAGFDAILPKPLTAKILADVISQATSVALLKRRITISETA